MIVLVPIGDVDRATLEDLQQPLEKVFRQRTSIADAVTLPPEAWDPSRYQYLADPILAQLPSLSSRDRHLGVANVDLYAQGLNFVFGQADVKGKRAVISLSRLRQEFYDLPSDHSVFSKRVLKEAVHELGHTYGIGHCADSSCVMHFSNSLRDTDFKGWQFCPACQRRIDQALG